MKLEIYLNFSMLFVLGFAMLFVYDWVKIPLVYAQVVTNYTINLKIAVSTRRQAPILHRIEIAA